MSILDYLFPSRDLSTPPPFSRHKLHLWAQMAPCIAVGIFAYIGYAYYPAGLVVVCFAGFSFIGFLIASKVLKMMGRDPTVLLAATPVLPVLVMVFFTALSIVTSHFKEQTIPTIIQKAYSFEHPNQPVPKETIFGFVLGETTYEQILTILDRQNASYNVFEMEGRENESHEIVISSYAPTEQIGNMKKMSIVLDETGRTYSINIIWDQLPLKVMEHMQNAYAYKYSSTMQKVNLSTYDNTRFYTPRGVEIRFGKRWGISGQCMMYYSYLPKQKDMENLQKKEETITGQREAEWLDQISAEINEANV